MTVIFSYLIGQFDYEKTRKNLFVIFWFNWIFSIFPQYNKIKISCTCSQFSHVTQCHAKLSLLDDYIKMLLHRVTFCRHIFLIHALLPLYKWAEIFMKHCSLFLCQVRVSYNFSIQPYPYLINRYVAIIWC